MKKKSYLIILMIIVTLLCLQSTNCVYAKETGSEFKNTLLPELSDIPDGFAVALNYPESNSIVVPYAYRETLVVAYKEVRARDSSEVTRYDFKYQTFQFLNGYTSTTTYTYIGEDLLAGKIYQANVKYSFY